MPDTQPRKRARTSGNGGRSRKSRKSNPTDEETKTGGAAFEVPDLPANFNGIPLDGGQYLAVVRREANRHAPVYRLASDHPFMQQPLAVPQAAPVPTTYLAQELGVPDSSSWLKSYTRKFHDLRDRIATTSASPGVRNKIRKAHADVPGDSNEGLWFAWIHGYRMRTRSTPPPPGTKVRSPSLVQLSALDHEDKLALIEWMTSWIDHPMAQDEAVRSLCGSEALINVLSSGGDGDEEVDTILDTTLPRAIPSHLALWLFCLLACLSPHLDSDETSTLRELVRTLVQAIRSSRERVLRVLDSIQELDDAQDEEVLLVGRRGALLDSQKDRKDQRKIRARDNALSHARSVEASSWMVIAAVIEVWRQTDLWEEIRGTLADV